MFQMFARGMTDNAGEPGVITWDCDPSIQELKVILGYVNREVEANLGYNTKPNKQKLHLTGYITIIHLKCFLPSLTWPELHPHDLHGGRRNQFPQFVL